MFTCEPRWISNIAARMVRRYAAACLTLLGLLLTCIPCHAHNTYPQQLADELNMPCVPQCTICHRDNLGGFSTVVEPFGIAMQKEGLTFFPPTLEPAVKKLETDMVDSDGDGVSDILELSAGQDPNGSIDLCAIKSPQYGCGAHIAQPPSPDHSGAIAALFMASVLGASAQRHARRRRRQRQTRAEGGPAGS